MKVRIEDKDALQALAWEGLKAYLDRAKGWKYAEDIGDKAVVYQNKTKGGRLREIIVPIRRDLGDYARRMADAVSTLARVEKRSELDVYDDLSKSAEAAAYKVHERIRKWLAEEGWHAEDMPDSQSGFHLVVTRPAMPRVDIYQANHSEDCITLSHQWRYASDVHSMLGDLPENDLLRVVLDIYRDASIMGVDFVGVDTPATEMALYAYVYFDGLTKDTLLQRMMQVVRALMMAGNALGWAVAEYRRSEETAPSEGVSPSIVRFEPRTDGSWTLAG